MVQSISISPLQALAAKWRVIALFAAAFARLMRRYEDGYKPDTYALTCQLELAVRAAHALMMQDIQDALRDTPTRTEADHEALAHLQGIAVCLLATALVISNIRRRVLVALCWMGGHVGRPINSAAPLFPACIFAVPIRDSS